MHVTQIRAPFNGIVTEKLRNIGERLNVAEVLTVPRDALILRREGAFVFRIDAESKAVQVNVITGLGAGNLIEIIGDINAGDRVVTRGAERLKPGMAVDVTEDQGGTTSGSVAFQ